MIMAEEAGSGESNQECESTIGNQGKWDQFITFTLDLHSIESVLLNTQIEGILWALTIGGSILFVIVSKVTILMKPLVNKSWYTELVLYLICLAMGTMLAAISFQLIPEGIGQLLFEPGN